MGKRQAGPPIARSVRRAGDEGLSKLLAEALVMDGSVDRATHRFHTYPARMHPDAAALLIEACPGPVHDPFCGGGTVLVEAMLAGRESSGTDLSPIAALVSRARTADKSLATPMRSAARKITEKAQLRIDVEVAEELQKWYQPHVAQELGRIRDEIAVADERIQPLLQAIFSSIIVKASFRKSDTQNRRETHHQPLVAILFRKRVSLVVLSRRCRMDFPSIELVDACRHRPDSDQSDCDFRPSRRTTITNNCGRSGWVLICGMVRWVRLSTAGIRAQGRKSAGAMAF